MRKNPLTKWLEPLLLAIKGGIYEHAVPFDETTYHSETWANLFGYRSNELPPYKDFMKWLYEQVHPDDCDYFDRTYRDFVEGRAGTYDVEIRLKHKSDNWIWVRSVSNALEREPDGRVKRLIGIMIDVTWRKKAEEELQSSKLKVETEKRYLEAIFKVLPVGVVITDARGGVVRTNNMDEKIWGKRPETLDVDDYFQYKAWWPDSGKPLEPHEWASAQAVSNAKSVIGQVLEIQRFCGERGYVINSAVPILNDEGRVTGSAVVIQDITELKHAEQEKLENIQGLNEYAYALTHNLKEPLRAIQNYVNFLFEDLADKLEGEPRKYLEGLKDAVTLSNEQFIDLETLYRVKNHPIETDLFEARELLEEMQCVFKNTSERKLIYSQNWPLFHGERFLIRQILFHLISNGFKFNCAGIKRVEVGWQAAEGNRIEIFVRDNGIGIDSQYHEQIFDIFKRLHTAKEYKGTGIGLAIVKRAVQRIRGQLRIESAIGKGSTFYVHLPNSMSENNQV